MPRYLVRERGMFDRNLWWLRDHGTTVVRQLRLTQKFVCVGWYSRYLVLITITLEVPYYPHFSVFVWFLLYLLLAGGEGQMPSNFSHLWGPRSSLWRGGTEALVVEYLAQHLAEWDSALDSHRVFPSCSLPPVTWIHSGEWVSGARLGGEEGAGGHWRREAALVQGCSLEDVRCFGTPWL